MKRNDPRISINLCEVWGESECNVVGCYRITPVKSMGWKVHEKHKIVIWNYVE